MKPAHLKWQKLAGYVLPVLLGWGLVIWAIICTLWIVAYIEPSNSNWLWMAITIIWLPLFPVIGFGMGVVNAYCWRNQKLADNFDVIALLGVFWLLSLPVIFIFAVTGWGFICIPIHILSFWFGEKRGRLWITNNPMDRLLGKKNDWERDDLS